MLFENRIDQIEFSCLICRFPTRGGPCSWTPFPPFWKTAHKGLSLEWSSAEALIVHLLVSSSGGEPQRFFFLFCTKNSLMLFRSAPAGASVLLLIVRLYCSFGLSKEFNHFRQRTKPQHFKVNLQGLYDVHLGSTYQHGYNMVIVWK